MLIRDLILNSNYTLLIVVFILYNTINLLMFLSYFVQAIFYLIFNRFETLYCPEPTDSILINFFIIRPRIKAFYVIYNYHINKKFSFKLLFRILKIILFLGPIFDIIRIINYSLKNKFLNLNICFNELWPYSNDKKIIIRDRKITRNGMAWRLCRDSANSYTKVNENIIKNENVNLLAIRIKKSLAHPAITHNFTNLGGWGGTSNRYSIHSFEQFINFESKKIFLYSLKFQKALYEGTVLFRSSSGDEAPVLITFDKLSSSLKNTLACSGGLLLIEPHLRLLNGENVNFVEPDVLGGKFKVITLENNNDILTKSKLVLEDIGGVHVCRGYVNHWKYIVDLYNRSVYILTQLNFTKQNGTKLSDLDKSNAQLIKNELMESKNAMENSNILFDHDFLIEQFNNFLN